MYCRKCGHEMQNDSNFCPGCGAAIGEPPQAAIRESNTPVLSLKPVFVGWAVMMSVLPIQIFMTLWGGGFFGGFSTFAVKAIDYKNITEVNLVRGIIQKKYGLGTIVLSTPATGFASGRSRSGIRIQDIPNAEQVYQQVKGLIQRATTARVA
jgi:hypothetical protein